MITKRLTIISLFTTIALVLFVLEAQVPVPIPGVKLGLSNIVTLIAFLLLGKRAAGTVLALRIMLGAFLLGTPSSILFSAAGGMLAFFVMSAALNFTAKNQVWVVSILGALAHNTGQILMAMLVLRTIAVIVYSPMLVLSGIVSGLFTGLVAQHLQGYRL